MAEREKAGWNARTVSLQMHGVTVQVAPFLQVSIAASAGKEEDYIDGENAIEVRRVTGCSGNG
ncbi:hypothetical protein AB9M62_34405 [Bacillales bacterium AN1005]